MTIKKVLKCPHCYATRTIYYPSSGHSSESQSFANYQEMKRREFEMHIEECGQKNKQKNNKW